MYGALSPKSSRIHAGAKERAFHIVPSSESNTFAGREIQHAGHDESDDALTQRTSDGRISSMRDAPRRR